MDPSLSTSSPTAAAATAASSSAQAPTPSPQRAAEPAKPKAKRTPSLERRNHCASLNKEEADALRAFMKPFHDERAKQKEEQEKAPPVKKPRAGKNA